MPLNKETKSDLIGSPIVYKVWFLLFYGIPTLVGYLMPKQPA